MSYSHFYFLGIGGIGMSAIARYFHHKGYEVRGYDHTPSPLTRELENEGINIVYDETISLHVTKGIYPTSLLNVDANKFLHNGQLIIRKADKTNNALGQEVK